MATVLIKWIAQRGFGPYSRVSTLLVDRCITLTAWRYIGPYAITVPTLPRLVRLLTYPKLLTIKNHTK